MVTAAMHPQLAEAFALSAAGRDDDARTLIEQLAARGEPDALFTLGDMYWRGVAVATDPPRGRELFRQASAAGHAVGARAYTNLIGNGIAGQRDWTEALRRLRIEARDDQRRALMLETIEKMDLTPEGDPRTLPPGRQLSESPHVTMFPGLLTPDECRFLMIVAEPSYEESLLGGETSNLDRSIRSSDGATLHWLIEDPATHALNRRLAAASETDVNQAEALQILRYRPGQEYKPHVDWQPGSKNQRIKTALVYLNEAYLGGETLFLRIGMMVRGHAGDCIVFRNTLDGNRLDPMSEHAGLPVTQGTKYLASRWIRAGRHVP
jgi:prolyl 4-hydroxylase